MGAPREISGGASLTLATALVPGPDISRNVISGVEIDFTGETEVEFGGIHCEFKG